MEAKLMGVYSGNGKKRAVGLYALQFGATFASKYLDVPRYVYTVAATSCLGLKDGRRQLHEFQVGDPCCDCVGCYRDCHKRKCKLCWVYQEGQARFVQKVQVEEIAHGLLEGKRRQKDYWCQKCAQKELIKDDPLSPVCFWRVAFDMLSKLNQKDFPPSWAIGRKVLRKNHVYDYTDEGRHHNLWNAVLDVDVYDPARASVVEKAQLKDRLLLYRAVDRDADTESGEGES